MNKEIPHSAMNMEWRYFKQRLFFGAVRLSALVITFALLGILAYILANGFRAITL